MAKIIGYAPIRKVFTSIGLFGGVLLVSTLAASVPGADEFARGLQLYQRDEFKGAILAFEQAVGQAPKMAKYHHWLGKAYGRLAERSSWMRAVELAKRTQRALEKAVELDHSNPRPQTKGISPPWYRRPSIRRCAMSVGPLLLELVGPPFRRCPRPGPTADRFPP